MAKENFSTAMSRMRHAEMTLDEKHTILMNEFAMYENETIPTLIDKRDALLAKEKKYGPADLDEYLKTKETITSITQQIQDLRKQKQKYLLENAPHIFDYFEHKKNVGGKVKSQIPRDGNKINKLNNFFKIAHQSPTIEKKSSTSTSHHPGLCTPNISSQDKYWKNVNGFTPDDKDEFSVSTDFCAYCNGEIVQLEEEGTYTCRRCGVSAQRIVDSEKPSYKEPPGEVSYTAYVRLNHFKEILSQFQAKESTQIPNEVMEAICRRIKKERIRGPAEITYARTREILRKLGYNKYFEHVQYINCKFGIKPPVMEEALVEVLCVLFVEIQGPWALHCPPSRQNFFGYNFVLHQLCKLLGADEFCPFIPMLKDPQKANDQDEIWRKVCKDLDWLYIPSPR
jgi:hypothetical protein